MIKRIASAALLIPIVVWLIFFAATQYIAISVLFISIIAYIEWLNMDALKFNNLKAVYFALNALFIFVFLFYSNLALYVLFFTFIIHLIINFSHLEKERMLTNYYYFLGILYVSLYAFLYLIALSANGRVVVGILFIAIWAGDSFAYFCGKYLGTHKLSPKISPKKTIEGALCGVVLGTISAAIAAYALNYPIQKGLILGTVVNIVGIFGDLSESVIKRAFNKKDSSNIIPGHGGILDRLDSAAFGGFFVYMMIVWKIL
jgi:phosphatidate cytidylyltransferase